MPGIVLGFQMKLYINTGVSYVSPTWLELKNTMDNTLGMEKDKANVTTRGNNGWVAEVGTLKTGTVSFKMIWDTTDAGLLLLRDAFLNNTAVELQVLDGPNTPPANGSEGLEGFFSITKFERDEPLVEASTVAVEASLTYYPAFPPTWVTI